MVPDFPRSRVGTESEVRVQYGKKEEEVGEICKVWEIELGSSPFEARPENVPNKLEVSLETN